ncbi:MAG: CRTAC1 family protein [Actinomycetota bacterium]
MRPPIRIIGLLVALSIATACVDDGEQDPGTAPGTSPTTIKTTGSGIGFEDVLEEAGLGGLPASGPTYGSTFVDADLDGWPDLLVGRHKRRPRLFLNREGRFEAVRVPALNEPAPGRTLYDLHSCNWGEADGDGRPDLYCVSGAQGGRGKGPNRLFVQGQDPLLTVRTSRSIADPTGRGRTANWLDVDADGDLDLFVANEIRDGAPSVLYMNEDGNFRADGGSPLSSGFPVRSTSWADWNNDGDPDVMVLGHGFRATRTFEGGTGASFREVTIDEVSGEKWLSAAFGDYDNDGWNDVALVSETRAALFRNVRGTYEQAADLPVRAGRMALWVDVDNDGLLDLFLVQGAVGDPPAAGASNHPNVLFRQQRNHDFERVRDAGVEGPSVGNSESAAAADFDRDGRMDLFVTHGYLDVRGGFELLKNTGSNSNNYLMVHLEGPPANPFAYGATVKVIAGDVTVRRAVTDGFTFRTQSSPGRVHVGVGSAEETDVLVRWPDGTSSCLRTRVNRTVEISFQDARRAVCASD